MKIQILDIDAHHRVNGKSSMTYKAGRVYPKVPSKIATKLIKAGLAKSLENLNTEKEDLNG